MTSVSIAEILANGAVLTTGEALAVAQSLFESRTDEAQPPFGPLSRANVLLRSDGSVTSRACAATPTVLEAAILVEQLLPEGHAHIPGALRYTLGRALHEVAAPPFDSLADFSRALRRFETGRRAAIVRALVARAADPPADVDSLWQSVGVPFAAALLAGVALIGAGEAMHLTRTPRLAARTAVTAIEARPIVFNPPPVTVRAPAPTFVGAHAQSATLAAVHAPLGPRATARRARPAPRRGGFPSRVLARVRIEFKEL